MDNDGRERAKNLIRNKYRELGPMSFNEKTITVLFIVLVLLWIFRDPKFIPGWGTFFSKYLKMGNGLIFYQTTSYIKTISSTIERLEIPYLFFSSSCSSSSCLSVRISGASDPFRLVRMEHDQQPVKRCSHGSLCTRNYPGV